MGMVQTLYGHGTVTVWARYGHRTDTVWTVRFTTQTVKSTAWTDIYNGYSYDLMSDKYITIVYDQDN